MDTFWIFLPLIAMVVAGIWLYRQYQENQALKKELEKKRQNDLADLLNSKADSIRKAVSEFEMNLNVETGFFSKFKLTSWQQRHAQLFKEFQDHQFEEIVSASEVRDLRTFRHYFLDAESLRQMFNADFIPHELKSYKHLFDNVEGRKLDHQQRCAIVTDEDNNIVIAGAGSGKTTTIVGKVNYVVERYKARPDEILLISFTNKSASTLSSRLKIDGVEVKTFHKFGKDVIATVGGKQPSIYDENQFRQFINATFSELIKDENFLFTVTEYFTDFIKQEKSQFDFEKQGDYIQFLKDQNFRPYHQIQPEGKLTLHREVMKSIEECKIANFLLFHGLTYEYESPYEYDTATAEYARWKPDFTVTQNGKTIYIEHFALNRDGDVPSFFAKNGELYQVAKERYLKKIEWARAQAKKDNTILVETYSYEMFDGTLYDNLKANLLKHGLVMKLMPPAEIWRIINDAAKEEVANFIALFQTFITLMKSNNLSVGDLRTKNYELGGFQRNRNGRFIEIISPIYQAYERHLASREEIDFSDMINRATTYIKSGQYRRKFSYLIVDEFQDISIGRYQLLRAIKDVNPQCKLFCVGDDWQSIYRFSGSDISLFKDFEKYFGFTVKSKIETTYRFHNPVLKLSSDFIQRNPNQTPKQLRSALVESSTHHEIVYSTSEQLIQDDTLVLRKLLEKLVGLDPNLHLKSIYLIGRYNNDINRIKNNPPVFKMNFQGETPSLTYRARSRPEHAVTIEFLTVHKAKGLEADIVIVINCNSGKYGFPSEMSDDPILNLLLSEADQFENGEERRLFYVAMTRAKERVYFLTDTKFKSKFIRELEVGTENYVAKKCPYCVTGDLVKRTGTKNGKPWAFYGCANLMYGCDYKEWINLKEG